MHFVHRLSGLKVADLLDVLRITKQSLGAVLKQLLDEGYIVQKTGNNDRRPAPSLRHGEGRGPGAKLAGCRPIASSPRDRTIDPAGQEVGAPVPAAR
jgi:hypothetical protein